MIYKFFLFKSAGIENAALNRETRLRFVKRGRRFSAFEWPSDEALKSCAPFDTEQCRADMSCHPVLSRVFDQQTSTVRYSGESEQTKVVGFVVKCHVRDRETIFAALLEFARKHGLSIADPCFGLLLLTSEREDIRGLTWLRLRRQQVIDWFSQMVKQVGISCLGHHEAEDYYVVVHGRKSGTAASSSAIRFHDSVKEVLFPDEMLEFHSGRIVLVGPGGIYKIHFNWESCGKNAEWTADFREPDCPLVLLRRISIRQLRRLYPSEAGFPVGMFDPRVVDCIPDPADRYASLALFNHKLTKRVPRNVVEELEEKRRKNP